MKAVQFTEYGGPDVLTLVEIDEPHAGPGEIRIATRAAGVNPVDWKIRAGYLAAYFPTRFPSGVGTDVSGVVDEVGDGVTTVSVGDEVFGTAPGGSLAEYTVLTDWVKKPAAMSFEEAAGLPLPTETAQRMLNYASPKPGQTLLINGAAGGVGLSAAQFAVSEGLSVIGTASEANHEYLSSIGVIPTTYGEGLVERVTALAPGGVDVALDAAGFGALPELMALTGSADTVVTVADMAAAELGVHLSPGPDEPRAPEGRTRAAELFERGSFRMPVAHRYPLDAASAAHEHSQSGHLRGKIIVTIP
ncbi:NADP-dependent oxidoreductase [Galbitalea soli]|uniref:NADP-dependent oxidoreductase n=1 Tax=Galbitalea soli TaxID=1268042 RepID=A0A7C9PN27_9MICO|nr:NADP-dependent oxidoreductase [Galbitalea soli]NEM91128.1 NADP-dependent oxidoreductase [Galbitalea soli]NYJ29817.1 NADPH:quinone reductase-like Zn-dependent oxidoreductase [Galbitalea soli]